MICLPPAEGNSEVGKSVENGAAKAALAQQFGETIRRWRVHLGYNQGEFAAKVGYSNFSSISNIEKGKVMPGFDKVQRIADFLGISVDDLKAGAAPTLAAVSVLRSRDQATATASRKSVEAEFESKLAALRRELRAEVAELRKDIVNDLAAIRLQQIQVSRSQLDASKSAKKSGRKK